MSGRRGRTKRTTSLLGWRRTWDRLSAELSIEDLELEGTEVTVGPYRADIVARIPQDGSGVLIENQLEHANLQHLGQVLAYLAGLEAKIGDLGRYRVR